MEKIKNNILSLGSDCQNLLNGSVESYINTPTTLLGNFRNNNYTQKLSEIKAKYQSLLDNLKTVMGNKTETSTHLQNNFEILKDMLSNPGRYKSRSEFLIYLDNFIDDMYQTEKFTDFPRNDYDDSMEKQGFFSSLSRYLKGNPKIDGGQRTTRRRTQKRIQRRRRRRTNRR